MKLGDLDQKVSNYFKFVNDSKTSYKILSEKDIENIKGSLTMIENFHIECLEIDKDFSDKTERILNKYLLLC